MKNAFYFDHDYNARGDQKILILRSKYGWEGYGLFFATCECLCESGGYIKREALAGLSFGLNISKEEYESFIDFCVHIKLLFENQKEGVYSNRILRHLNYRKILSDAGKLGGRGNKREAKGRLKPGQREAKARPKPERKEEDRKEEDREEEIPNESKHTFDQFWDLYDKKTGRIKCEAKYKKLSAADKEKIFTHIPGYKLSTPDVKFRKDPFTYLSNRSWEDEFINLPDEPHNESRLSYSIKEKYGEPN